MRAATAFYTTLALLGAAVAVAVPVAIHRSGSAGVPFWAAAAVPGPLSRAHAFLGAQCEACHVPTRGIEATSCIGCHATAAPELLTRPSTAFHQSTGECAGCHIEHRGGDRRPINMDHGVLVREVPVRTYEARTRGPTLSDGDSSSTLARLQMLLAMSGAELVGGPIDRRFLSARHAARLDCAGCHTNRDPHRMLFGRDCQGCHDTLAWAIPAFRHPSSASRNCVQCHQAPPSHYMMHFMMLQMITGQGQARVEQCYTCHQTDSWNNIRGVGWFDMH